MRRGKQNGVGADPLGAGVGGEIGIRWTLAQGIYRVVSKNFYDSHRLGSCPPVPYRI